MYYLSIMKYGPISILVFCCLSFLSIDLNAQTIFQPKPINYSLKGVVYDFETTWEARIFPQGWAVSYRKGRLKSYYRTTYQNFEFGYIKHRQERRHTKPPQGRNIEGAVGLPKSYIFGKANQFFNLRYSRGEKHYLSEKTRRKGVAVGWIYEGGASIGLLKPYYLRVIRTRSDVTDQFLETLVYDKELDADFLDFDRIFGGTSFWKGWDGVTPTIGLHGKLAMHWSMGAFEKKVKAIEAGVMVDVYPRRIPLIVERDDIKNSNYFIKLYVGVQIGSRKRLGGS